MTEQYEDEGMNPQVLALISVAAPQLMSMWPLSWRWSNY
jgi:hypothetical protein